MSHAPPLTNLKMWKCENVENERIVNLKMGKDYRNVETAECEIYHLISAPDFMYYFSGGCW